MRKTSDLMNAVVAGLLAVAMVTAPAALYAVAPAVGQAAPDFTLKTGQRGNLRLSEHRGEVVMINFWATWCGPCREEMPLLNQLYKQYGRAGFTLLGVNVDENAVNATHMARQLGVGFPILFDADKRVSRLYNIDAMPSTALIDRDGRLRFVHRGYRPGYEKKYEEQIRELLKE